MKFESNLQEGNGDVIATRCGFRSEIAKLSCVGRVHHHKTALFLFFCHGLTDPQAKPEPNAHAHSLDAYLLSVQALQRFFRLRAGAV